MDSVHAAWMGLVMTVAGLSLLPLAVRAGRVIYPGRSVFFARWGFSHLAVLLLLFVSASTLVGGLGLGDSLVESLLVMQAIWLACAGLAIFYANKLHPEGFRALGLRSERVGSAILLGATTLLFVLPLVLGLGQLWPWLFERLGGTYAEQDVVTGLRQAGGMQLFGAVVIAVVVAPFFEELVFRGFVQPLLIQNLGELGGLSATSALFALSHGAAAFLPIFGLSLALGAVMLRSKNLVAAWTMHALFNGLQLLILLTVPETLGAEALLAPLFR